MDIFPILSILTEYRQWRLNALVAYTSNSKHSVMFHTLLVLLMPLSKSQRVMAICSNKIWKFTQCLFAVFVTANGQGVYNACQLIIFIDIPIHLVVSLTKIVKQYNRFSCFFFQMFNIKKRINRATNYW